MAKINAFLDRFVLPYPVKFLTNRFIILMTISLLIPLIVWAREAVFVLAMNSYLNTVGVAVSSIVLLYATLAETRDKQIAVMQEQRAQEDHQHVVEMHQLVLENMDFQHEEMENLKQILGELAKTSLPAAKLPHGKSTDLRALHAGGRERFERSHVKRELGRHLSALRPNRADSSAGRDRLARQHSALEPVPHRRLPHRQEVLERHRVVDLGAAADEDAPLGVVDRLHHRIANLLGSAERE